MNVNHLALDNSPKKFSYTAVSVEPTDILGPNSRVRSLRINFDGFNSFPSARKKKTTTENRNKK